MKAASLSDFDLNRKRVVYCYPKIASISSSENSKTVGTISGLTKAARESLSAFPSYLFSVVSNFLKKTIPDPSTPLVLAQAASSTLTKAILSSAEAYGR